MDSVRLPGKAMQVVRGLPVIHYVLSRARRIPGAEVVLATTERRGDDVLADYGNQLGVRVYRGSAEDVAGRMLGAALEGEAPYFIRLNADSVFADPDLVAEGLSRCSEKVDLVTNLIGRTFPYGVSVEIMKTESYRHAYAGITTREDREHATSYLYANPGQFTIARLVSPHPELSRARLVVDTEEDLETFRTLAGDLGDGVLTCGYREAAELYLRLTATR
jgi:spore coat polysaccharide biosynthesis protein SpsF